jgi:hypothetical protein
MSAQFWPCPGCSRHVKRDDATCPFCGATASVEIGPTRVLAGRLSRAALFAAGAVGAAVATTDCSSQAGSQNMAPAYGGSTAPDCGAGCVAIPNDAEDASANGGSAGAAYGAVPIPIEPEDSGAGDSTSESATDAGDSGATMAPTDSSSVADAPILVQQAYGAAVIPDE